MTEKDLEFSTGDVVKLAGIESPHMVVNGSDANDQLVCVWYEEKAYGQPGHGKMFRAKIWPEALELVWRKKPVGKPEGVIESGHWRWVPAEPEKQAEPEKATEPEKADDLASAFEHITELLKGCAEAQARLLANWPTLKQPT